MVYDQTDQTEQDEVVQREGPDLVTAGGGVGVGVTSTLRG